MDAANTAELPPVAAQFSRLGSLSFGASPIEDVADVALYLSKVLPPSCKLACEPWLSEAAQKVMDEDTLSTMEERRSRWREVAKLLPVLHRARADERKAINAGMDKADAEG